MTTPADWDAYLRQVLPRLPANLAPGLNAAQLAALEDAAGAVLPGELRILLSLAVPVGAPQWPNWHIDPGGILTNWTAEVRRGLLFDIEYNGAWFEAWGTPPADPATRLRAARERLDTLPRLLPLYAHRAIALDPAPGYADADGNPVFSVHQSDVVYYGNDLAGWLHREFAVARPSWSAARPRWIPFWSPIADPAQPPPAS
ncbi:hypothetical protein [Streptacidiphilus sp. EB103A]|uniref:hypothetical protein n=1 Tax=Streptacidiphilus sp. EB103A TaxID=3156275 RepID=UPI00351187DE